MQVEQDIPASALVRVYVLGPLTVYKRDQSGAWKQVPEEKWKNSRPARSVLKRLLVQPGRRLSREQLADDVWSESGSEPTGTTVYNAISLIRGVIGKSLVKLWGSAYEIAGQTLIWTDIDAAESLLKSAENQGHTELSALIYLERALVYLERGELLEGEYGRWCYAFQKRGEDLLKQCRLWLAESYEMQGKLWQAGEQYRAMVLADPSDEEALLCWLKMLYRHGKRQEALKCYQDMKGFIEGQGLTFSKTLEQMIASLNQQPIQDQTPPFQLSSTILFQKPAVGAQEIDLLRRQFLQGGLYMTRSPLVATNLLQRFQYAFSRPLPVDETLLQVLESRTEQFWQNRHTATFTAGDLWSYVADHLHKILTFLQASLLPAQRSRLCTLLCKTAQLAGVLTYDAGQPEMARTWYSFAIQSSHEAHDPTLEAIVLGWMTFTWLADHTYDQALLCAQKATAIARGTSDRLLIAWLQATEAETLAHLHQSTDCLTALRRTEALIEASPFAEHLSLFNLDQKQLWGYQGACLQQLYLKDDPATHCYLREAQAALEQAISGTTLIRRQITYLHDLAGVYARREEVEAACATIIQSLPLMNELGEYTAKKRLSTVRTLLESAAKSASVRALDEQIAVFFA